ncbi:hypothetical protein BDW59DRAFT_145956 [Aspergillus cavernicola]|uniref:ABM domain-containing protein n=1 Tax=Aspergillus cavernicola TaxID=176166 RepID=A0ABR4IDN4_9EURO
MPVTELACLHLKTNTSLTSLLNQELQTKLYTGLKAQANHTNTPVYLLTQIADPSCIYIIAHWEGVSQHMEEWIPSDTNQRIMEGLKDGVEVVWLQHVEGDLVGAISSLDGVIGIRRYIVAGGDKEGERDFDQMKRHLKGVNGPTEVSGSLVVDSRDVDEAETPQKVFMLLSRSSTINEQFDFGEEELNEFTRFKGLLEEVEAKHARWTFTA